METGSRVIFLPEQPGVYLALNVEPNLIGSSSDQDLSDTQSVSSLSSFGASVPLAALKKRVTQASHFLDMAKLPSKTQTILSKFEMIVIAKLVNVVEQHNNLDESINVDEVDLAFDRGS